MSFYAALVNTIGGFDCICIVTNVRGELFASSDSAEKQVMDWNFVRL